MDYLNIFKRCKRYRLKTVWQCPDFLFLFFGIIIILVIILTRVLAFSYIGPELTALLVLIVTALLFIVAYSIVKSFEYLALTSEMKSEFISIMSHQLRSPLVSIKWMIESFFMLKENPTETKNILNSIQNENERMLKIISKFLELKKIEEAEFFLKKQKCELLDLIKNIAEAKKKLFPAAAITVNYDQKNCPYEIFADSDKITFVLENLIDNGLKYSPEKKEIEILAEKTNDNIKISVSDKGLGVSPEKIKNVFNKFAPMNNSLKYTAPGLGIGLYLSKKIIEAHSGKIGFQTQKEKGSTFWFTLPTFTK